MITLAARLVGFESLLCQGQRESRGHASTWGKLQWINRQAGEASSTCVWGARDLVAFQGMKQCLNDVIGVNTSIHVAVVQFQP